jgi:hypothetical protein
MDTKKLPECRFCHCHWITGFADGFGEPPTPQNSINKRAGCAVHDDRDMADDDDVMYAAPGWSTTTTVPALSFVEYNNINNSSCPYAAAAAAARLEEQQQPLPLFFSTLHISSLPPQQ